MKEIALHLLDLAENSVTAQAHTVEISVCEDLRADRLSVCVKDDGKGMPEEVIHLVCDPFFTSRTKRAVGLGIPLFKEAAEACRGGLQIDSQPGAGTQITAVFQHSHIDRMPLGNLPATFLSLLVGHPEIHWIFHYSYQPHQPVEAQKFTFDDQPVKEALDGLPLTHPQVLAYLRETLESGLRVGQLN